MITTYNLVRFILSIFSVVSFIQFQPAIVSAQVTSCPVGWTCTPTTVTPTTSAPVFSIVGTPTLVQQNITPGNSGTTTTQYTAIFNVSVSNYNNAAISLGLSSSANPAFQNLPPNVTIYKNGVSDNANISSYNLMAVYSQPSNTTISTDGKSFIVAQNQSVTIPVTYVFTVINQGPNIYNLGLSGVVYSYSAATTTNYMTVPLQGCATVCPTTPIVPVTPVTPSSASVTGQPTLRLSYNANSQQSSLKATFYVSISAGSQKIGIYHGSAGGITFVGPNGDTSSNGVTQTETITPLSNLSTSLDTNGNSLYVIPAGQTASFTFTDTINPQLLFGGVYRATLGAVSANNFTNANGNGFFQIIPAANKTNIEAIVGEVSPYITSVTSPVSAGQKVTITGQRLTNGTVEIDNSPLPLSFWNKGLTISYDGTSLSFTLPSSVISGNHTLFVKNVTTGASNNVLLQVTGTTSSSANMVILAPVANQILLYGQPTNITWGGSWSGNDVFDITEFAGTNGKDLIAQSVTQSAAGCPGYGKSVCGISWTPKYTSSQFQIAVSREGSNDIAYSGTFTVANSTSTPITYPSATVNGTPTLALSYDSNQKESLLTATFNITVNGGSNGLNIYKNAGGAAFYNSNGTSAQANSESSTLYTPINSSPSTVNDNYGQAMYTIPAGQSVTFQGVVTIQPGQLFAGTYYASLVSLYSNPGTNLSNAYNISVPSNQTNTKTIVGELGPYITSVTSPVATGQTVTVSGQRLGGSIIYIDNAVLSNVVITAPVNGTSLSFILPSSVAAGSHNFYVSNSAIGASNQVRLITTIGVGTTTATTTLPTNKPPVISGSSYPTTLTVGQTGTWSIIASDPQNGSLGYAINWGDSSPTPAVKTQSSVSNQTSTFTHAYANPGNYTVTFTITDTAGLSAQSSGTVNVTSAATSTGNPTQGSSGYNSSNSGSGNYNSVGTVVPKTNTTANVFSGFIDFIKGLF